MSPRATLSAAARWVVNRDEPQKQRWTSLSSGVCSAGEPHAARIVPTRLYRARIRLHLSLRRRRDLAARGERCQGRRLDRLKLRSRRAATPVLSPGVWAVLATRSGDRRMRRLRTSQRQSAPELCPGPTSDGVEHPGCGDRRTRILPSRRFRRGAAPRQTGSISPTDIIAETMLALQEEARRAGLLQEAGLSGGMRIECFLCNVNRRELFVFPTRRVLHSVPGFDLTTLLARLGSGVSQSKDRCTRCQDEGQKRV